MVYIHPKMGGFVPFYGTYKRVMQQFPIPLHIKRQFYRIDNAYKREFFERNVG
jgi:hypothetical protein